MEPYEEPRYRCTEDDVVTGDVLRRSVERAMWAGDEALLQALAPCRCCCAEHTFETCPARSWEGCKGQFGDEVPAQAEVESWVRVYAASPHWMTRAEFFGGEG
jgi:hypothetical protein